MRAVDLAAQYRCLPLAQLMKNTGVILANDANAERLKSVVGNLHRLGVTNAIISHYDGRQFPKVGLSTSVTLVFSFAPREDMLTADCRKDVLDLLLSPGGGRL